MGNWGPWNMMSGWSGFGFWASLSVLIWTVALPLALFVLVVLLVIKIWQELKK